MSLIWNIASPKSWLKTKVILVAGAKSFFENRATRFIKKLETVI